ncbi:hypothetical protein [Mycolicibacterium sp.]|uniref:hypothetical protein n=1 Tax=Mycolicibacterium sp. TaxID=2320850 RepID=UPI001A2D81F2|nr:hypothetical protein [Mycolicibacterium sp.]MBJ7337010.1 hypothetical protein [Mycolicibacterium sp.]
MHSRTTRRIAAGIGVAAFISMGTLTACGGSESPSPSSTTTTTTTAPSVTPTEKSINPGSGNSFSPGVKAPPAPTGMPGTNHTG